MALERRSFLKGTALAGGALMSSSLLAACSDQGGSGDGGGDLIPFSNKSLDFYFFVVIEEAIRRAVEARKADYEQTNANFDAGRQAQDWSSLLLKSPAGLICNPIDSDSLAGAVDSYKSAGVPIAIVDTPLTSGEVAITIAFDNREAGAMAARRIVELITEKNGAERGQVLEAYADLASFAWRLRHEGFEAEMAKYPDIELISRPTEGDPAKVRAVMDAALAEFPDLDAAHAPSDGPGNGLVAGLEAHGRYVPKGEDGHVIVVTIDGEPQALDRVREGYFDGIVVQDPIAYGEIAVDMLMDYSMKGKDIPLGAYENDKYYWTKGEIISSDNGPQLVQPPYFLDESNVDDKRHWGNVAPQQWDLKP